MLRSIAIPSVLPQITTVLPHLNNQNQKSEQDFDLERMLNPQHPASRHFMATSEVAYIRSIDLESMLPSAALKRNGNQSASRISADNAAFNGNRHSCFESAGFHIEM